MSSGSVACPYCEASVGFDHIHDFTGGCEHVVGWVTSTYDGWNPSWFRIDIAISDIDNPAKKQKLNDFRVCSEETLKDVFQDFYNFLDAYERRTIRSFDMREYFQRLMEKLTFEFDSDILDQWPTNDIFEGDMYFAKAPNEIDKHLKATIFKVEQCFKYLKKIMKCPYCKTGNKSERCTHYLMDTNPESFTINLDYPKLPNKLKNNKWEKQLLTSLFGDLYDTLKAYKKGYSEDPDKVAYFEKLMKKVTCKYSHRPFEKGKVYFAEDVQEALKQIHELSNRLSWLFRGLAYSDGIKTKEKTKANK